MLRVDGNCLLFLAQPVLGQGHFVRAAALPWMPSGGRPGPNQPELVLTQRGSFRTAAVRQGFVVLSRDGFMEVSLYLLKALSKAIWGTVPEIYFDG